MRRRTAFLPSTAHERQSLAATATENAGSRPLTDAQALRRGALSQGRALEGQAAIVTGSGRRIGRATALALARAGAAVVINARSSREEAERVAAEVAALGGRAQAANNSESLGPLATTQPPLAPAAGPPYRPVVTLNGWTLPFRMNGEWKQKKDEDSGEHFSNGVTHECAIVEAVGTGIWRVGLSHANPVRHCCT